MYTKNLSDIFGSISDHDMHEHRMYPWGWSFDIKKTPNKILYSIGDSWLDRIQFTRVVKNNYPEYININRAISGANNSLILQTIKNDLDLLSTMNVEIVFLVVLTEVGRSRSDLGFSDPKKHSSVHTYFGEILKNQHVKLLEILEGQKHYITTAFVPNNFNSNKTIIDFCGKFDSPRADKIFSVSSGIFQYLKDREKIFQFNFADDVEKSIKLKNHIVSHEHIDQTLHPTSYVPYEKFLENVFFSLKKN